MKSLQPHRRWNPLRKEWLLVSPHRGARPWLGQLEKLSEDARPSYDPSCALCPGNNRVGEIKNPAYDSIFTFDNDFPAIFPFENVVAEASTSELQGLIQSSPASGACRVICFSPKHDLTLPELSIEHLTLVVNAWQDQYLELAAMPAIKHVMIFENKGAMMGCSNPHPHGQIWATNDIPNIPAAECASQEEYFQSHARLLLSDYLEWEISQGVRVVCSNDKWVCLVPYWAAWPYETLLIPRRAVACINELSAEEKIAWASLIKEITTRYDNLFECSFPYSMGVYQKPTDGNPWLGFCLHQVFFPPLLRSATVRKFMVGFELCAETQRDITPEQAAARLRECSNIHYKGQI